MALIGSLFFNRTLKQFLECSDLSGSKGQQLVEKIRQEAPGELDKILQTIPQAKPPHSTLLKQICQEVMANSEDQFLDNLQNDDTVIRNSSREILSESQQINPSKLLKRLHEPDASKTEIIDILEFQRAHLSPELLVKNALRLHGNYAKRLLEMATSEAKRTDMSALDIDVEALQSPDIKIQVIRFLAAVNQAKAATLLMRFLKDDSKIIKFEALKNLNNITVEYDPSPIARMMSGMAEEAAKLATQILRNKITDKNLPNLTVLMTGKSDSMRKLACKIARSHINSQSLEQLLLALDQHEWWGKEQALKCLINEGGQSTFVAAALLIKHENEFVSNAAEQLAANQATSTIDINQLMEPALSDNWQVRERAIDSLGHTKTREALGILNQVIDKYPESAVSVLKAVSKLGFSKGLEIASKGLKMKEAQIQRESLVTMNAVVTDQHALKVRDGILKKVPELQVTVRDTALEVLEDMTERFNLSKLNLHQDSIFETRLLKVESYQEEEKNQAIEIEKTEVVSFQRIEELKPGDHWMDRYKIEKEIGRGAMGRVMLVEDEAVGEQLILKFMHPELTTDPKSRERFLRELKYSRKISHPNVIRIHDFLLRDGISAISMEYFESHGLDYMLKKGEVIPEDTVLNILDQVSDGMLAAHQQGVIHRDLKPSNILINQDGLAKVVDFGIASVSSEGDATLTKTGMIIGTPAYLSPERAKGLEADHRSDIYALGIIAYALFSGSLPYKGEPMSLLFQHIEGKATPLFRLDKGIKVGVSMLVEKMMAADIEKRYQSMQDVRDTIKELI